MAEKKLHFSVAYNLALGYCHGVNVGTKTNKTQEAFMETLAKVACAMVARGAAEYLTKHNLIADPETLSALCRQWCKRQLPLAIAEFAEAAACHMEQVGESTFKATMILAGISAAKDAMASKA